jgi:octaprenyl-diphosphate synthase
MNATDRRRQTMALDRAYAPIAVELRGVRGFVLSELERLADAAPSSTHDGFVQSALRHLFNAPGKGLRPALLLLSARAAGLTGSPPRLLELAATVELIHSASLVHDDIIDESHHRRSYISTHGKYGVKVAVLVGDTLFTHAFTLIRNLPDVDAETKLGLIDAFTELTRYMCFGEMAEQRIRDNGSEAAESEYYQIVDYKTARLMGVSCKAGAVLAGAPRSAVDALEEFGRQFGFAYQLMDDLRDGDCLCGGGVDLAAQARMRLERGVTGLSGLLKSPYVEALRSIGHTLLESVAVA